jgi:tetrahydromethanopterin S-methyltransferase subunit H
MFKRVLRTFFFSLILMGLFCFLSVPVAAVEPPNTIRFELTLSNSAGPLEGPKRVDIQLRSEDDVQWSETHFNVPFIEGQSTLILGSENHLTPNAFNIASPNFAILVEGDEVSINVHAVPYAVRAYSAEYVSWNNILGAPDFFDATTDLEVHSLAVSTSFTVTLNGFIGGDLDVSENLSATTLNVESIYLNGSLLDPNLTNSKVSAFTALATDNANFIVSDGDNWIVVSNNVALSYLNTQRLDPTNPTLSQLVIIDYPAITEVGIFQVNTSDIVVTHNRVGIGTTIPSGAFQVDTYDATTDEMAVTFLVSNNAVLIGTHNYNKLDGAQLFVNGSLRVSGDIYGRIVDSEVFDTDFTMNSDTATNPIAYRRSGSLGIGIGDAGTTARLEITDVNDAGAHAYQAYIRVRDITESHEYFAINMDGYTGIGTLYPSANLHVSGNIPLIVESQSTPNMFVVSANGLVGIGTHMPQEALEVSGNISANMLLVDSLLSNTAIFTDIVTINVLIPSSHIELGPTSHIQLADGGTLNRLHNYLTTNVGVLHIVTENLDDEFVTYNMMRRTLTLDHRSTLNITSGNIVIGDEGGIWLRDNAYFHSLGDGITASDGLLEMAGADDFVTYLVEGREVSFNAYTTVNVTGGNFIVTENSHLTLSQSSLHLTRNSTLFLDSGSGLYLYGETASFNALAGNITINSLYELDLNISSLNAQYWNSIEAAASLVITDNSNLLITGNSTLELSHSGLIVSDNSTVTVGATGSLIATSGARVEIGNNSYLFLHNQTDGFNALGEGLTIENNALTINLTAINALNDATFVQFDVDQRVITLNNYTTLNVVNSLIYASQNAQVRLEDSDITLTNNAGLILGEQSGIVLYDSTSSFNRLGASLAIADRVLDLNIASMNLNFVNATESNTTTVITDNATLLLSESSLTLTYNASILVTNNSAITIGDLSELVVTDGALLTIGTSGLITMNGTRGFNALGDGFLVEPSTTTLTLNSVVIRDVLVGTYVPFTVNESEVSFNISSLYLTNSSLFVSANSLASITENSTLIVGQGSSLNITANASLSFGAGSSLFLSNIENGFNTLGNGLLVDNAALTLNAAYLDARYVPFLVDNETVSLTNNASLIITANSLIEVGSAAGIDVTYNALLAIGEQAGIQLDNVDASFNTLASGLTIDAKALNVNYDTLNDMYARLLLQGETFTISGNSALIITGDSTLVVGMGSSLNVTENALLYIGYNSGIQLENVDTAFNTLGNGLTVESDANFGALNLDYTYLDQVYVQFLVDNETVTISGESQFIVTSDSTLVMGKGTSLNVTDNALLYIGHNAGIQLHGIDNAFNTIGDGLSVDSDMLQVDTSFFDLLYTRKLVEDDQLVISNNSALIVTGNSEMVFGTGTSLNVTYNAFIAIGRNAGILLDGEGSVFNSLGNGLVIQGDSLTLNATYLDATYVPFVVDNMTFTITNNSEQIVSDGATLKVGYNAGLNLIEGGLLSVDGSSSIILDSNDGFNTLGVGLTVEDSALTLNSTYLSNTYAKRIIADDTQILTENSTFIITGNAEMVFGTGTSLNVTHNAYISIGQNAGIRLHNESNVFNTLGTGITIESNALTLNTTYLDTVYVRQLVDNSSLTITNGSAFIVTDNSSLTITDNSTLSLGYNTSLLLDTNSSLIVSNDATVLLQNTYSTFNRLGDSLTANALALDVNYDTLDTVYSRAFITQNSLVVSDNSSLTVSDNSSLVMGYNASLLLDADSALIVSNNASVLLQNSYSTFNRLGESLTANALALDVNLSYLDNFYTRLYSEETSLTISNNSTLTITGNSSIIVTGNSDLIVGTTSNIIVTNNGSLTIGQYAGIQLYNVDVSFNTLGDGLKTTDKTLQVALKTDDSGLEFVSGELSIDLDDNPTPLFMASTGLSLRIDDTAGDNGLEVISDADLGGTDALAVKVDSTNSPLTLTEDGIGFDIDSSGPLKNEVTGLQLQRSWGLAIDSLNNNGLTLQLDTGSDPGLELKATGLGVKLKADGGLLVDGDGLYTDTAHIEPYLSYETTNDRIGIGQTWYYHYRTAINTGAFNSTTATFNQVVIGNVVDSGDGIGRRVKDGVTVRVLDSVDLDALNIFATKRAPLGSAIDVWSIAPSNNATPLVLGKEDGQMFLGDLSTSERYMLSLDTDKIGLFNTQPDNAIDITIPSGEMLRVDGASNYSFVVLNDGSVGIGTSAPAANLEVAGFQRISNSLENTDALRATGNVHVQGDLAIRTRDSADLSQLIFYNYDNNGGTYDATSIRAELTDPHAEVYDRELNLTTKKMLRFQSNDYDGTVVSQDILVLTEDGRVGIGTTHFYGRDTMLSVTGDIRVSGNMRISGIINSSAIASNMGDFSGTLIAANMPGFSDQRLKDNVSPLVNAVSVVKQLQGVSFMWNDDSKSFKDFPTGKQYGFIAQDVQKVLPSIVGEHKGYLNVNYDAFIALLTEALKEQQAEIESQEDRISKLESLIEQLADDIEELKSDPNRKAKN